MKATLSQAMSCSVSPASSSFIWSLTCCSSSSSGAEAVSKNFLRFSIYSGPLLFRSHWNSLLSWGLLSARSSRYVHSSTFSPLSALSTTVKSPQTLTKSSEIYSVVFLYFSFSACSVSWRFWNRFCSSRRCSSSRSSSWFISGGWYDGFSLTRCCLHKNC